MANSVDTRIKTNQLCRSQHFFRIVEEWRIAHAKIRPELVNGGSTFQKRIDIILCFVHYVEYESRYHQTPIWPCCEGKKKKIEREKEKYRYTNTYRTSDGRTSHRIRSGVDCTIVILSLKPLISTFFRAHSMDTGSMSAMGHFLKEKRLYTFLLQQSSSHIVGRPGGDIYMTPQFH